MKLKIPLGIRYPEMAHGKNYMIHFETKGNQPKMWDVTTAYNMAILEVMREEKLNPFHQVGERHVPGYHGWEALFTTTTEAKMLSLLPIIEARARTYYKDLTGNAMP